METRLSAHIVLDPGIRFGKPCIKGTRIAVVDVLEWLASGMTCEEILEDFPQLRMEHLLDVFAFLANRQQITYTVSS
jgi:uncharacterized protein (DUF433 family)